MNCGNCGTKLSKDDAFCPGCGAKLIKSEKRKPKYSVGKAYIVSLITAVIVFFVPMMVLLISGLGNAGINETFSIILRLIQYICPVLIIFFMPWILYLIKNR